MLEIAALQFNMFGVNTYIVWNPYTKEAAIIDPGMIKPAEQQKLDNFISDNGLSVKQLINTHMHVDHIFGDNYVKSRYNVPIMACTDDAFLGERAAMQCRMFGLPDNMAAVEVDKPLTDGDTITIGGETVNILTVPGHSPGSIVLYFPTSGWAITGDVIFQGSIGRTDLVAGNHPLLIDGIKRKILTLPPDTILFPGHGDPTTVAAESHSNPYL
jgi:glyoxylase-like metal-dependent hydrolase (beta-lactamase superfamily II)